MTNGQRETQRERDREKESVCVRVSEFVHGLCEIEILINTT